MTVTAVSASGLKAADKSGTSDPYCVFTINGEKVHKTEIYKKQLNPVFKNESFVAPVISRNKAKFEVKIYDWDQFGSNELLAEGTIPIADLESFAAKEVEVPLRGGKILLRLKWEPQLLARKREGTSLLGSTTRILTGVPGDVVGLGVGAGGKVISGGTKVVGGGAKMVGGAIGGGIGAIGGGIGAIGRGFGKIGGHGRNQSTEVPVVQTADGSVLAVPTDTQGDPIIANSRQSVTSTSGVSAANSGPRSVFGDKDSKFNSQCLMTTSFAYSLLFFRKCYYQGYYCWCQRTQGYESRQDK